MDYKKTERYQKGLKVFESKYEKSHLQVLDQLYEFSPELADVVVSHGLSEIWVEKTPNLTVKEKELMVLASLITSCTVHSEIKAHAFNLLNIGASKDEIKQTLVLLTLYIGVPKVIVAMRLINEAFIAFDKTQK